MEPNKIAINLEDYPDLVDESKGAGPGDKITVKVTFAVDESSDKLLVGSIVAIDGKETGENDSEDASDTSEGYDESSPVFSVMSKK